VIVIIKPKDRALAFARTASDEIKGHAADIFDHFASDYTFPIIGPLRGPIFYDAGFINPGV
jgi:hypothetical protein